MVRNNVLLMGGCVFLLALTAQAQPFDPNNPIPAAIGKSPFTVELQTVATGLVAPNYLTHAGDGTDRLFVVDQTGQVRLIQNGVLAAQPFLNLGSSGENRLVTLNPGFDERGLLGLAFHPDFANVGMPGFRKLYTYSSEPADGMAEFPLAITPNHQSVVTEWQVSLADPNLVDPASRRVVMRVEQPQFNHNSGMLAFGPGGLYIGLGDGGGANDTAAGHSPQGNGQDRSNPLGAILRVDPLGVGAGDYTVPPANPFVGVAGAVDEIFAYGLRNPFRFTFDGDDLIIGDVGQGDIEEVNRINAVADDDGVNFGWRVKEGTFLFDPNTTSVTGDSPGLPATLNGDRVIDPVVQYDHDEGISVIGGFVYRGSLMPHLQGLYIFGDFSQGGGQSGRLFISDLDSGVIQELRLGMDDLPLGMFVKGFGQDAAGELYLLAGTTIGPTGSTGVVLRIIPEPSTLALLALAGVLTLSRPSGLSLRVEDKLRR